MADWGFGTPTAAVLASIGVEDWVFWSRPVHRPSRTLSFDGIIVMNLSRSKVA